MSDFPFSIPRRGDADVVNGVSYAGTTLTLTRAEGSDLTTTIATSDPTKIENGNSKMEIATSNGACVFTPAGLTAKTTTFAANGDINTSGNINCALTVIARRSTISDATVDTAIDNRLTQVYTTAAGYTAFDKSIILSRSPGSYRPFEVGMLGDNTSNSNVFCIAGNGGGGNDPDPVFALSEGGTCEIAADLYAVNLRASTTVYAAGSPLTSDDRIKENEKLIVNATETLSKLTPQIYDKYRTMDLSGSFFVESGLIAQEVYYNAPELRHLVTLGKELDASGNEYTPTPEEMDLSDVDIANDPDYGSHGWSKTEHSWLNYQGLIPYLIKSNQEMAERLAALENK